MQSLYFRRKANQNSRLEVHVSTPLQYQNARLEARVATPLQCLNARLEARFSHHFNAKNARPEVRVLAPLQCQNKRLEARVSHHFNAKNAWPKARVQHHLNGRTRGSKPAPSIISMTKRKVQARVSTAGLPCVSVVTVPITGSIIAHVMRGVNTHYREILGDSFTPRTPYK